MAKTLVVHAHLVGPRPNGFDGCYARFANEGICPGVETAQWLNSLGDDAELFGSLKRTTNGTVRDNWIRGDNHIRAKDRRLWDLRMKERQLVDELAAVQLKIKDAAYDDDEDE